VEGEVQDLSGDAESEGGPETEVENPSQSTLRNTPIHPSQSDHARVSDDIRLIQQQWSLTKEKQEQKLALLDKEILKQDHTGWYNRPL
jgi:hypothetical protein